jgi:PUA domain protein
MAEIRIRKRKRLRSKDARLLAERMESIFGMATFSDEDAVDVANSSDFDLLFINGRILGMLLEEEPFLTIRGVLHYRPEKRFVTVDMGAVPYVTNGADIMTPGITDADPCIEEGDLVWIRDIRNLVPLAIGRSLLPGRELVERKEGKGVSNIHYVGDRLWKYEEA